MTHTWRVSGSHYHERKSEFKELLQSQALKWKGNYATSYFIWRSKDASVQCKYDRDLNTGINVSVTITYTGDDDEFARQLFDWAAPGIFADPVDDVVNKLNKDFRERISALDREVHRNRLGTGEGARIWLQCTVRDWYNRVQSIRSHKI